MAAKKEVTIEAREKAIKALMALPTKTPETEPLEDALKAMKPAIKSLLLNGYTRQEVVDNLVKQGIPAKLYHLKPLLAETRGKTAKTN